MSSPVIEEKSHYLVEFDEAIEKAKLQGFTVYQGDPRTLLLDLDTKEAIRHFDSITCPLAGLVEFKVKERWASKSGIGEHVIIVLNEPLAIMERLFLQACLGSDALHELLSFFTGVKEGNMEPSVLFRPPQKQIAEAKK